MQKFRPIPPLFVLFLNAPLDLLWGKDRLFVVTSLLSFFHHYVANALASLDLGALREILARLN